LEQSEASEVKGLWFVTAKDYILEHHGSHAFDQIVWRLDKPLRPVLTDCLTSEWYPEIALSEALAGMSAVLARGVEPRFREIIAECTTFGVNRFFRALLGVTSPRFVMRRVPAMWKHVRRGAGRVEVCDTPSGTLVRYRDFPRFYDPNYRTLTLGSLTALLRICSSDEPKIGIKSYDASSLDVEIVHD